MVAVSYNNLWKLLIDKGMNKNELKEAPGVSFNVMARMGKNKTVSLESLEKICMVLNCNIGDIMDITTKNETRIFSTIELFAGAGGLARCGCAGADIARCPLQAGGRRGSRPTTCGTTGCGRQP